MFIHTRKNNVLNIVEIKKTKISKYVFWKILSEILFLYTTPPLWYWYYDFVQSWTQCLLYRSTYNYTKQRFRINFNYHFIKCLVLQRPVFERWSISLQLSIEFSKIRWKFESSNTNVFVFSKFLWINKQRCL